MNVIPIPFFNSNLATKKCSFHLFFQYNHPSYSTPPQHHKFGISKLPVLCVDSMCFFLGSTSPTFSSRLAIKEAIFLQTFLLTCTKTKTAPRRAKDVHVEAGSTPERAFPRDEGSWKEEGITRYTQTNRI